MSWVNSWEESSSTSDKEISDVPVVYGFWTQMALMSPGPTATEGANSTRLPNKMGKELESWCSEKKRNKLLEQAILGGHVCASQKPLLKGFMFGGGPFGPKNVPGPGKAEHPFPTQQASKTLLTTSRATQTPAPNTKR
ncbi:hypothetical protein GWK47_006593 [Chionoecetes opilio]|uniref:Uncharacterized protein n=1 Tax=Chionoecetes opilio TaxID=41210 RepID=A0A8J4YAZ4_CHIOP|nr:hypothetical protein GWK47_006593 [Chionoecetes opilio]